VSHTRVESLTYWHVMFGLVLFKYMNFPIISFTERSTLLGFYLIDIGLLLLVKRIVVSQLSVTVS